MEDTYIKAEHNLMLESRKKAVLTGVTSVIGFSSDFVTLETAMGNVELRGENLKINNFNNQTGDAEIIGSVFAIVYSGDSPSKGFFSKLFK